MICTFVYINVRLFKFQLAFAFYYCVYIWFYSNFVYNQRFHNFTWMYVCSCQKKSKLSKINKKSFSFFFFDFVYVYNKQEEESYSDDFPLLALATRVTSHRIYIDVTLKLQKPISNWNFHINQSHSQCWKDWSSCVLSTEHNLTNNGHYFRTKRIYK